MTIRKEHKNTFPIGRIPETLLMFIRARGGAEAEVNSAFVYAPLADFYELSTEARSLSLADYYVDETAAGVAWNSEVNSAIKGLKKEGYLTVSTRSRKTALRLTPSGAARADFWLRRMTEKTAALNSLRVDPQLTLLESVQ